MDVMQAIRSRRSVRKYQPRDIEAEKLQQVLEAGRLAPSANNRQLWKFIVVRDAQIRQKLVKACCDQAFIAQAPIVIIICATDAERRMRSGMRVAAVDPTIATDHMTLAATSLGLGTCWIGAFHPQEVATVANLPADVVPIHVLPLGYPDESPPPRPRKSPEEVICWDTYQPMNQP